MGYCLNTANIAVNIDTDGRNVTLWHRQRNERLLMVPNLAMFYPVLDGKADLLEFTGVEANDSMVILSFRGNKVCDFKVYMEANEGFLRIWSSFTAACTCELSNLVLFPEKTGVNLYDIVNFRNRHHTPSTWPELNFGGKGFETDTYSRDWQFAPHPSMFILRKNKTHLLFGALDLPKAFGMYFYASDYRVNHWYLDYGMEGYGQELKQGEKFISPSFCMLLTEGYSVYDTIGMYADILIKKGYIPDPAKKIRFAWHEENLYCTWIDQIYKANITVPAELYEQGETAATAVTVMDERLVRNALKIIKQEKLPFRTILLDEGWEVTRGQWEPHPVRFPDLRKLVDEIHDAGMKVIVWWNWAELCDDAEVEERHLLAGGKRNKHSARMRDYSNPATREEYLKPLFHKLFSPDKGCFDLDGVKTDFLADKVHADMPVYDPGWRGEENYFFHVYQYFYNLMRSYKPDACHIGCAGHPYLAEFIDINRTYDVHAPNPIEHFERGRMLKSCTPGCPVAFDLHCYVENYGEYFDIARREGFSVQVGNIMGTKKDLFSEWEAADEDFYRLLRQGLARLQSK